MITKEEAALKRKKYYEENKSKEAAKMKAYYESNKAYLLKKAETYRNNNKETIAIKQKTQSKAYRLANPDKRSAWEAKRRSSKLLRTPKWLTQDHFREMENFYIISKWFQASEDVQYHVDHIIPLQGELVSGLHVPWNLQVITATENMGKSNNFNGG